MAQMNHEFEKTLYGDTSIRMREWDPKCGNPHHELCTREDLKAFVQVGKDMGIEVKVLAKDGQKYYVDRMDIAEDSTGAPVGASFDCSTHKVPKGSAYIEIANEMRRMGEFYTKVDALSEQAKIAPKPNHK